jgi:sugar phosphate isomerase/epimerase
MRAVRPLKGAFPFSFGVTSYLYPAGIIPNLRRLRRAADEMELILFEGRDHSNLPSPRDVGRMRRIARRGGMRFNVHLPLDIDVASMDDAVRDASLAAVARIVGLTAPLEPLSYTLHVLKDDRAPREAWRARVAQALSRIPGPHDRYCVETLAWDLREIADIIADLGYSVCIDIGHLLAGGRDIEDFFSVFAGRIGMIHLHGVRDGKDHQSLAVLDAATRERISRAVRGARYAASLCLEVFAIADLAGSRDALVEMFGRSEGGSPC